MLMSRKIWLVLAIAALVAVSFAASVVAARRAGETRSKYTTHALDYLHARQGADGGFTNPENTAWAILGMIAKRERQGSSAWRVKGSTPFQYLQKSDLAASAASGSDNAPVYYSRLIMAFVAARQSNQVASAGSKGIDLLAELWRYQDSQQRAPSRPCPARTTTLFTPRPGPYSRCTHSCRTPPRTPTSRRRGRGSRVSRTGGGGFSNSVKGQDRQRPRHLPGRPGPRGRPVGRRLGPRPRGGATCGATRTPAPASPTAARQATPRPT